MDATPQPVRSPLPTAVHAAGSSAAGTRARLPRGARALPNRPTAHAHRPSLLLGSELAGVPEAVARLRAHYTDTELARMVSAEPLLLVEDVDAILAELER